MKPNLTIAFVLLCASAPLAGADPMQGPRPTPQVTAFLDKAAGTLACSGKTYMPDGKAYAMTGTLVIKGVLDNFWIHEAFTGAMPKLGTFAFEMFTTFDVQDRTWHRMMMDSIGGYMIGTSSGPVAGKLDFELAGSGPMGTLLFRDHTDGSDPKVVKSVGERSVDKGKTWQKDYELACTR